MLYTYLFLCCELAAMNSGATPPSPLLCASELLLLSAPSLKLLESPWYPHTRNKIPSLRPSLTCHSPTNPIHSGTLTKSSCKTLLSPPYLVTTRQLVSNLYFEFLSGSSLSLLFSPLRISPPSSWTLLIEILQTNLHFLTKMRCECLKLIT